MIAEALAGKRIAITGRTGFVGTALVERLLRGVPDCELVLLVRDGKRTPAARAGPARDLQEQRLRPPAGRSCAEPAARRSTRWPPGAITTIAGDVSTDGLGPRRRPTGRCSPAATSSSTPPPPCRSTRRSTRAVEINLLGPTRIADTAQRARRRAAPRRGVSTCYVAGNRRGNAPEELVSAGPFDLGLSWRRPRSRRPAGCAATPRPPAASPTQLVEFRAEARTRARRRRRAGARREDRAAARALGAATSSSRPAGPAPPASAGPTPTRSPRRSASRR